MNQKTTLFLCFIFFQLSFSFNGDPVRLLPVEGDKNHVIDSANLPLWSMEYRLLLQNPTQGSSDLVKVYPNPVNRKDNLNIALSGTGKKEIAFYDITGKMVKRLSTEKNSMTMNVSDLGAGVYILNVKSDSIQITKKVIIR